MKVDGVAQRTIRLAEDGASVEIIDQTRLPFEFAIRRLGRLDDAVEAIQNMRVRGAPLIGVTAAYGLCLRLREDASDRALEALSLSTSIRRSPRSSSSSGAPSVS